MAVRAFILVRAPTQGEEEGIDWAIASIEWAQAAGVECCVAIPTRGGNGAMERLAEEGLHVPPSLASLERVQAEGIRRGKGRVFADLWGVAWECAACGPARLERMRRMNHEQAASPPVEWRRMRVDVAILGEREGKAPAEPTLPESVRSVFRTGSIVDGSAEASPSCRAVADVAVLGGGFSGSLLAAALARRGFRVAPAGEGPASALRAGRVVHAAVEPAAGGAGPRLRLALAGTAGQARAVEESLSSPRLRPQARLHLRLPSPRRGVVAGGQRAACRLQPRRRGRRHALAARRFR